jgi:hypothetical protein
MCYGCYEEAGSPAIVNEKTLALKSLAERVYDFCPVGGNLHIVLDDWNLEDDNLAFCRGVITRVRAGQPDKYDDTNPEQVAAEDECLTALEAMTEEERYSALAIWDGYLVPGQTVGE